MKLAVSTPMSTRMAQGKNLVLFGFAVVGVAAIIHGFQLASELRIAKQAYPFEADLFPVRLRLFLFLAFLLTAAGLAFIRTLAGLICSMLGLIGVFVAYLFWVSYSHTLLIWVNQDGLYERHPDLRPPSFFGLVGAHWWDFVLLALLVVLFVWEVKLLVSRPDKRNHHEP